MPPPQHLTINGMPAAITTARVNADSGLVDASVVAYQWDAQRIYHFVMLTPGGTGVGPFAPMVNSLRQITPAEAAAIRPRIIHVVTVAPGDTVQSLASRMAYRDFKLERFLSLNGLAANSRLVPGREGQAGGLRDATQLTSGLRALAALGVRCYRRACPTCRRRRRQATTARPSSQ